MKLKKNFYSSTIEIYFWSNLNNLELKNSTFDITHTHTHTTDRTSKTTNYPIRIELPRLLSRPRPLRLTHGFRSKEWTLFAQIVTFAHTISKDINNQYLHTSVCDRCLRTCARTISGLNTFRSDGAFRFSTDGSLLWSLLLLYRKCVYFVFFVYNI